MKKQILAILAVTLSLFLPSCSRGPAGPAGPAAGTNGVMVVNMQDGLYPDSTFAGTLDAGINSENPDSNYGSCGTARAGITGAGSGGICRVLLKFNINDALPVVTPVKVYLRLYAQQVTGSVTIRAYKAAKTWDEGAGACAGAIGGAAWNEYSSSGSIASLWQAPGGDFSSPAISDAVTITGNGYVTLAINGDNLTDWMEIFATNMGFIIKADNETLAGNYADLITKEDTSPAMRPRLTVYYCLQ